MEQWMCHLKRTFQNNNLIVGVLNAAKTLLSWVKKRNMIEDPFETSAIVKPKEDHQKRGILFREEVAKITALPVLDMMKPRPRLKDGNKERRPHSGVNRQDGWYSIQAGMGSRLVSLKL
jgi:hypothetical protein